MPTGVLFVAGGQSAAGWPQNRSMECAHIYVMSSHIRTARVTAYNYGTSDRFDGISKYKSSNGLVLYSDECKLPLKNF